MACRGLKSLIIDRYTNPTELLKVLQMQLEDLKVIASETDFTDKRECEIFCENITHIKRYFEIYNRIIENS